MTDQDSTPTTDELGFDPDNVHTFVPEAGVYLSLVNGGFVDPRYLHDPDGSESDLNRITWDQARTFTTAYSPPDSVLDAQSAFYYGWRATHPDFEIIEVAG